MRVLSNTFHGKVTATANQGFSIKRSVKKIKETLSANGYHIYKEEIANTGTTYLSMGKDNDDWYSADIRISNHTKRGYELEYTDTLEFWKDDLSDVNILNTEMLHEFIAHIAKI